ncbi:hypothetical protein BC829DRAFT_47749 [Chytridium lagenaria]|nr:hypothetical protein BC829DRAFT_47749 [Chytridium lagenaria]
MAVVPHRPPPNSSHQHIKPHPLHVPHPSHHSHAIRWRLPLIPPTPGPNSALAPLVTEIPIIVSPYTKELASHASIDSPWLFLPMTDSGVSSPSESPAPAIYAATSTSVELPPNCWRPAGDVEGELPSYSQVISHTSGNGVDTT